MKETIKNAMVILYTKDFQKSLPLVENPYVNGKATEKILDVLTTTFIPVELKKEFHDL